MTILGNPSTLPFMPRIPRSPTGAPLSDAEQRARLMSSPVYIRRVSRVAKLVAAFVPYRHTGRDVKVLTEKERRRMAHYMLEQVQVEDRPRRARREAKVAAVDATPTTSLTY